MKISAAFLRSCLALVVGCLVSCSNSARAASSCDIAIRLDALMVSSNIAKVGFPALLEDKQNPTIFFKKRTDLAQNSSQSCYVCHERSSKTVSDTWQYDGITGNAPVLTNFSGLITYHSATNGQTAYDCTSTRTGPNTWSDPTCSASGSGSDVVVSNRTISSYLLVLTNYSRRLITNASGTSVQEISQGNSEEIQLTLPYSLSDFASGSLSALNAAPWSDWTNAQRTGWAERGGRDVITIVNSERAEFNAALTKLKYRIAVRGPKDDKQTITWTERFTPNGGGTVVDTQFTEEVTFTGEEQYLAATSANQGKTVSPPTQAGRLEVLLVSNWSCDGPNCGPGKGKVSTGSIDVRISLGKNTSGESAGYLAIKEEGPRADLATPYRLQYFVNHDVQVVKDGAKLLQVSAPQTLAQVVSITNGYEVRFYGPSTNQTTNGVFIPTGQTFATWRIESPGGNPNKLRVKQIYGGDSLESNFEWSAGDNAWGLVIGNFRKEIRSTTVSGIDRTETFTIREINDALTYKEVRTWRQYGGLLGDILISEAVGQGAGALTTTWTYYTNATEVGSYGKIKSVVRPNGAQESYEYDGVGRLSSVTEPFASSAQGKVTYYFYGSIDALDNGTLQTNTARTVVESLLGETTRRTLRIFTTNETLEIQCATAGSSWTNAGNLIITNRTYSVGGFNGTVESSAYADGTLRIVRTPTIQPGVARTRTEEFGRANATGDAVVDGTRHSTQFDGAGRVTVRETVDISSVSALFRETYEYADAFGPPSRVVYLDGSSTSTTYQDCCSALSTVERDGTLTSYTYDALGRLATTTRNGITLVNTYDAANNIIRVTRIGTDSSSIVASEATFDAAGRQLTSVTGGTNTTSTVSSGGGSTVTTTYPDGGQSMETYLLDGSLAESQGSAVSPVAYEFGVESDGGSMRRFAKEIKGGSGGSEWTKTYFDMLDRPYKTLLADGNYKQGYYDTRGQLWKERGFDARITLYAYNTRGEVEYSALDVDNVDVIDLAGTDRVVQTVNDVSGGKRRTRTYIFPTAGSSNSVLVSTRESSGDGLQTSQIRFGATTSSQTEFLGGGISRTTDIAADNSRSVSYYQNGRLVSVTRTGSGGEELGRVVYGYDPHGRLATAMTARTGTITTYEQNNADQITSASTPALGGIPTQTTTLSYDGRNRVILTGLPDGLNLTNEFTPQGQLSKTFGARTYPVESRHDLQGRLTNFVTTSSAGSATTGWGYDGQRGWLAEKKYANNAGPSYTYAADGRLLTRVTTRGTITYGYSSAGDLSSLTFGGAGQDVAFLDLDRMGRPAGITVGTNSASLVSYHDSGRIVSETAAGLILTNTLDGALRKSSHTLKRTNGTTLLTHSYAYDGASRLQTITAGSISVSYTYLAKSPLVQNVVLSYNGAPVIVTTRTYDHLNRLTEIGNVPATASPLVFTYRHNLANQRTNITEADASYWVFQYDSLGQVTSGKKYFSDGTPVAGQQFEYTFDAIGNRTQTKAGGNASGVSLREATYSANNLNQITSRGVPNAFDVLGQAPTQATVTVNGQSTYRKNDYWQIALSASNSSSASWVGVTSTATLSNNSQSTTGKIFLAATPESLSYDDDGNLSSDGRWNLDWDLQGRLLGFTSRSDTPTNSWFAGRMDYDWRGRRISKVVSNWNGAAWVKLSEVRFAWDGWRLIAELDANSNLLRSYVWGADLSGTLDGAGGVGGLLAMIDHAGNATYFYAYDGNGNVRALINTANGTVAARYDYGPFHELLRATGPMAKSNPFLAATKYLDWETGFYYYGYRYYDPVTGRWLTREPLGENAAENVYAFLGNRPVNTDDVLGQYDRNRPPLVLRPPVPDSPGPADAYYGPPSLNPSYGNSDFAFYTTAISITLGIGANATYEGAIRKAYDVTITKLQRAFEQLANEGYLTREEAAKRFVEARNDLTIYTRKRSTALARTIAEALKRQKDFKTYEQLRQYKTPSQIIESGNARGSANAAGRALNAGGKICVVAGLTFAIVDIAGAPPDQRGKKIAGQTGGAAGGVALGIAFGEVGASLGPVGAAVGYVTGTVTGAILGQIAGENYYDAIVNE